MNWKGGQRKWRNLAKLVDAIALAQTDWRDVLVGADFAEDPLAHESWWPRAGGD
ncbi:MAG: hypothetical protein Q8R92_16120 [Deltaproteobacteria bacterium]|nr:hypothetical protein [Deltaproteobacteria bacterium]